MSRGECPGGSCLEGLCPRTIYYIHGQFHQKLLQSRRIQLLLFSLLSVKQLLYIHI